MRRHAPVLGTHVLLTKLCIIRSRYDAHLDAGVSGE